jgi:hypothetical protein
LAITQKSVNDLNHFIEKNKNETNEIQVRSTRTTKISEHLIKMTKDSKNGKNISSEEMALKLEADQIAIEQKRSNT